MSLPRTPQSSQHTPRTRLRVRETSNRNNNLSGSTAGVRNEATNGDRTPILPEERDSAGPVDFQRAVEGIQPAPNGAIPRVTVNQFANPPPGSDGIDRARENRFSIGPPNLSPSYSQERSTPPFVARGPQQNHLPPPFVAGGVYAPYSQPPPDLQYG